MVNLLMHSFPPLAIQSYRDGARGVQKGLKNLMPAEEPLTENCVLRLKRYPLFG